MITAIPTVSFWDSLRFNLFHVVPYYLQGIFTSNRFWMRIWTTIHPDPLAVKFISRLRRKYDSPYFYIYVLTTKSLWVLDGDSIQHVLDNSPHIYADSSIKFTGMSHFQPGAVTITRGETWDERRQFNETVLDARQCMHRHAGRYLHIIQEAVGTELQRTSGQLQWQDVETLFETIALQIILGEGAIDTQHGEELKQMMRESNRVFFLGKSDYFDPFYERASRYLQYSKPDSLMGLCRQYAHPDATWTESQASHWLFAMKDTLAENTIRALALIAAHPEAERRVMEDMAGLDLGDAQAVNGLQYLEGCVQEAMRLWPTTPLLVRETTVADVLSGHVIPAGTQVVVSNNFHHRDRATHAFADTFSPDIWRDGHVDYHFNHLSNGTQVCAGKHLALFIAKAVLATLLSRHRFTLLRPALNPGKPMPYTYNYFSVVFACAPR